MKNLNNCSENFTIDLFERITPNRIISLLNKAIFETAINSPSFDKEEREEIRDLKILVDFFEVAALKCTKGNDTLKFRNPLNINMATENDMIGRPKTHSK